MPGTIVMAEKVKGSSKGWEIHEDKKEEFQAKVLEITRKHKGEGKLHKIIEGVQAISKEIGHETAQTKHTAKSQPRNAERKAIDRDASNLSFNTVEEENETGQRSTKHIAVDREAVRRIRQRKRKIRRARQNEKLTMELKRAKNSNGDRYTPTKLEGRDGEVTTVREEWRKVGHQFGGERFSKNNNSMQKQLERIQFYYEKYKTPEKKIELMTNI